MKGGRVDLVFLLTGLYLPNLLIATTIGMLNFTVPLFGRDLGITYVLVGVAAGGLSIGRMFFDVPSSLVFERLGDRNTVAASFCFMVVAAVGLATARSFEVVVLALLLFGAGISMWNFTRIYFVASNISFTFRGRVSSMFGATQRIGFFAGPILAGFAVALVGFKPTYAMVTVVAAVAMGEFLMSRRGRTATSPIYQKITPGDAAPPALGDRRPEDGASPATAASPDLRAAQTLSAETAPSPAGRKDPGHSRRSAMSFIPFLTLIMVVRNGRYFLMPLYGVSILHMNAATVGLIVGLSGVVDMVAAYPSGYMQDRYGRAPPTALAFSLFGAGLLLMAFSSDAFLFIASAIVIGLGNGLSAGILLTLGADTSSRYSGGARSRFLGIWNLFGDTGSALGPILMGSVSAAFGLAVSSMSLAGLAVFIGVGLPVLILIGKRQGYEEPV